MKKTLIISALVVTAYPVFAASQVACTMEARLCPDGSYVGRQGPNCEFASCPGATSTPKMTGNATSSSKGNATSSLKSNSPGNKVSSTTVYIPNASATGTAHRSAVATYVQSIVHTIGGWFSKLFGK